MAIWFWTGANLSGPIKRHILSVFHDQYEINKELDATNYYDFHLWYADVDVNDIWIDPDDGKIYYMDVDGNTILLGEQEVDWADISASYNDLTGQISISCSKSIPVVVEVFSEDGYQTFASYSSITSASFFAQAGKYRIRRNWANELEASNVVYLDVVRSEIKHTPSGEKLLVGRYGQLQVGKTPDDPDYDANYDKTYVIFGIVKLPFTVSGSAGDTLLTATPTGSYVNTPSLLAYLKFDANNTNYLNLVKIKNDIYFAKPSGVNSLKLQSGLVEDVTDEPLYVVNQFKIFSDIFLASEENKVVFEDSQMTMEDWGGTVAVRRDLLPDQSFNFLFESGTSYNSDIGFHINKVDSGVVAGRIKIGITNTHDPYILFSKSGTSYCIIYFRYDGSVSYIEFPNGLKFAFGQTTDTNYPNGTLLVDSSTGDLKFKKSGVWKTVQLA